MRTPFTYGPYLASTSSGLAIDPLSARSQDALTASECRPRCVLKRSPERAALTESACQTASRTVTTGLRAGSGCCLPCLGLSFTGPRQLVSKVGRQAPQPVDVELVVAAQVEQDLGWVTPSTRWLAGVVAHRGFDADLGRGALDEACSTAAGSPGLQGAHFGRCGSSSAAKHADVALRLSLARRSSPRRRPNSLRPSLLHSSLRLPASASAWRTHRRNVSELTPRSRATWVIMRPDSKTRWAPRYNSSSEYFLLRGMARENLHSPGQDPGFEPP